MSRPLLRGRWWALVLLALAALRLYVLVRAALLRLHVSAELLTECGDHDGRMRFRDLAPRPDTRHD